MSANKEATGKGIVDRARGWLSNWLARRQGHYVPEDSTEEGWHGRGGHDRHQIGWKAEEYAASRLWSMGYHVLERNVRIGRWEMDIVAQHGDTLVFVEVRSGRDDPDHPPRSRMDADKRRSMLAAGHAYIKQQGLGDVRRRHDLAEVILDDDGKPTSLTVFRGSM